MTDSGMPPFGRPEDGMGDDRISHILSEASSMIKPGGLGGSQHNLDESADESDSTHNQCSSPFSKDSQNRRLRKYDNDDISHDKVARIYQEELQKLMTRAPRDAFPRYVVCRRTPPLERPNRFEPQSSCLELI